MSCGDLQTQIVAGTDGDESDYGSDFTTGEEELLTELLSRIDTGQVATSRAEILPTESQSLPSVAVPDIEDYEAPRAVHSERPDRDIADPSWMRWPQQNPLPASPAAPGQVAGNIGSTTGGADIPIIKRLAEHSVSTEGRQREQDVQQAREQEWTQADDDVYVSRSSPKRPSSGFVQSPLERFRRPPKKALSVSDLISPAWCELQYWYILTKHGRKRRTKAMRLGSAVHKTLEDQVHTTVPVEVSTKEDAWALRIWNVVEGLRTLRELGMTRELEIWGLIDGEIVNGVIDELSYDCPDHELEAAAAAYYADAQAIRCALSEHRLSITDYLLSSSRGGKKLSDLASPDGETPTEETGADFPSLPQIQRIYVTDVKTRASRSLPTVSSSAFWPTRIQLQMYYHILTRLTTSDDVTIEILAKRYGLNPQRPFSDKFITDVGELNEQFFDAPSTGSDTVPTMDEVRQRPASPGSFPASSEDPLSILLAHNNLSALWGFMKRELRLTFLPSPPPPSLPPSTEGSISLSIPSPSQLILLESYPTVLSPVLTARYLASSSSSSSVTSTTGASESPEVLGSRSFLFDPTILDTYVTEQMRWWRGKRHPRGVEAVDAWKCRTCDFRDECSWRGAKEREFLESKR